jgi:hypothetical protein
MKLHLIATVLLAVAAPDAVSAKKVSSCSTSPIPCGGFDLSHLIPLIVIVL